MNFDGVDIFSFIFDLFYFFIQDSVLFMGIIYVCVYRSVNMLQYILDVNM